MSIMEYNNKIKIIIRNNITRVNKILNQLDNNLFKYSNLKLFLNQLHY